MKRFDLDTPLIRFSTEDTSWNIRHAVEGVQIFGGIGSGKTSGSGRMLALKYLKQGFGGLVLTVKPEEKNLWQHYCKETNRTDDLIIIEPDGKNRFNFLNYESVQSENNEAITENIVEVLKTVIRAGEEKDSGKTDDHFWESALDMLMFNLIDLCKLAYGSLSLDKLYGMMQSVPKPEEKAIRPGEMNNETDRTTFQTAYIRAYQNMQPKISQWNKSLSPETREQLEDDRLYNEACAEAIPDVRLLKFIHEFFYSSLNNLSPKTRSIIEFIFSGFLFRLLREPVYSIFCKGTSTVTPDDCLNGKIILINLPVKKFHKVGRDCQILFKYIWQRRMEKREVSDLTRPVFLWADEAQNFIHEHDADFQATARSSKIATVYITQNLPNYFGSMNDARGDHKVKSFLGTLATKIFHANADIETNQYASNLIGDAIFSDPSMSVTVAEQFSQTKSISFKIERRVRPEELVSLKTGGPLNEYKAEGYFHKQGGMLFGKQTFKKMNFNQLYIP